MPVEFTPPFRASGWAHKMGVSNDLKTAILAAGLGRRMDPLTARHLPKPMFPLVGKIPMAEVWVRRSVESGIPEISMNLCVLADTVRRHFRDGLKFGASISYVDEEIPSGTLGGVCKQALGKASKLIHAQGPHPTMEPFGGSTLIVPSGDIVCDFGPDLLQQMYQIHIENKSALTIALVAVPDERKTDYGTAVFEKLETWQNNGGSSSDNRSRISGYGRIKKFFEKDPKSPSNLSNASIYMMQMDLIRALDPLRTEASLDVPNPFYDFGKHVFPALLRSLPYADLRDFSCWGVEFDGHWFDVGQKRDYLRVNEFILDGNFKDIRTPYEKLPWGYLGNNVHIDFARTTLIPPVIIGNNCVIEPDAVLGPYAVIGDDWTVQRKAHIEHSVLWQRYSYFDNEGHELPMGDRELIDRHTIRKGVHVRESIVAGGDIEDDLDGTTVDVQADGNIQVLAIDEVPHGPRA